jgi:hypothetical protein
VPTDSMAELCQIEPHQSATRSFDRNRCAEGFCWRAISTEQGA